MKSGGLTLLCFRPGQRTVHIRLKSIKKFDLVWGLEFGLNYCILHDFGACDPFGGGSP